MSGRRIFVYFPRPYPVSPYLCGFSPNASFLRVILCTMPLLILFDDRIDACGAISLPPYAQMPFVSHLGFSFFDFVGGADLERAWTDRRALLALDRLAASSDVSFTVCGAFRRRGALPRRMGVAFDLGRGLPSGEQHALRRDALRCGAPMSVLPSYLSGNRVTVAFGCAPSVLQKGSRGAAVCALQDALLCEGLFTGPVTGVFDESTRRAVLKLQRLLGLPETGAAFPCDSPLSASLTTRR